MKKSERDKLREILQSTDKGWVRDVTKLLDSYERMVDALKIIAKAHEVKRGACMKEAIAIRARQALKEAGEELNEKEKDDPAY